MLSTGSFDDLKCPVAGCGFDLDDPGIPRPSVLSAAIATSSASMRVSTDSSSIGSSSPPVSTPSDICSESHRKWLLLPESLLPACGDGGDDDDMMSMMGAGARAKLKKKRKQPKAAIESAVEEDDEDLDELVDRVSAIKLSGSQDFATETTISVSSSASTSSTDAISSSPSQSPALNQSFDTRNPGNSRLVPKKPRFRALPRREIAKLFVGSSRQQRSLELERAAMIG